MPIAIYSPGTVGGLDVRKLYGAVGDDATDDTQAFVDAVTDAKAQGLPVIVPPGTYRLTTWTAQAVGTNDVVILGQDSRTTVVKRASAPATATYTAGETFLNFAADSRLIIRGIGFENWSNVLHSTGNIGGNAVKEVTIDNCRFEQCNHAVLGQDGTSGAANFLVDEWNVLNITNCTFLDMFQGACFLQVGRLKSAVVANNYLDGIHDTDPGAWAGTTSYDLGDFVRATDPVVGGTWLYRANSNHTSGATFNQTERDTYWRRCCKAPSVYAPWALKKHGFAIWDGFDDGSSLPTAALNSNEVQRIFSGNVIKNINKWVDGWTMAGIQGQGAQCKVIGNHFEEITRWDDVDDCEAVYLKSRHSVVSNNTLKNAGTYQGGIVCKSGVEPYDATNPDNSGEYQIVTENHVLCDDNDRMTRYGISLDSDHCFCENNTIAGTYMGVDQPTGGNYIRTGHVIRRNFIKGLRGPQFADLLTVGGANQDQCVGIELSYDDTAVTDNEIEDLRASPVALDAGARAQAIRLRPGTINGGPRQNVQVCANKLTDIGVYDSAGGTVNSGYGIAMSVAGTNNFTADAGTDVITTSSAHGLVEDERIWLRTTTTLPAPLAEETWYWVVAPVTSTTFKLATTQGGTAINITDTGTGTHSIGGFNFYRESQFDCNILENCGNAGWRILEGAFDEFGGTFRDNISRNLTNFFSTTKPSLLKIDNNKHYGTGSLGIVTSANGTGSIAVSSNSDVIAHGMKWAPDEVQIQPTNSLLSANGPGAFYFTSDGTNITVTTTENVATSQWDFSWRAKSNVD